MTDPSGGIGRCAALVFKAITRCEELCLASGILCLTALTIANVFCRSLFETSLVYVEEISQFLIIAVTFLGLGYAVGKGRHIRMTALYDQWSERTRKGLTLIISATTAALLFYLAFLGFRYTLGTVHALGSVSPVLRMPLWCIYLVAPIGFVLAGIQYTLACYRNLSSVGIWLSFETRDEYGREPPAEI